MPKGWGWHNRHGDRGWFDFQPMQIALPTSIWVHSQDALDWRVLRELVDAVHLSDNVTVHLNYYVVADHLASTNPSSPFSSQFIAHDLNCGVRRMLMEDDYTVEWAMRHKRPRGSVTTQINEN